jgi:hypothetical protein
VKLLRTIRLDPSDTFVFDNPAEPGEWAVTGAFMFAEADPATLEGRARAAFRAGFLGVSSLGWSTLVQIVEASEDDRKAAVETLAKHLIARFGAPDMAAAVSAAEGELEFAAALCNHAHDTLIALQRTYEAGEIREVFRTLRPRNGPKPLRAFAFLEAEDDAEPAEEISLTAIAQRVKGGAGTP